MIPCVLCGETRTLPIYPQRGAARHRACRRCGLVRQPEPLEIEDLRDLYAHTYFEERSTDALAEPSSRDRDVRDWLLPGLPADARVVEVGIGWGGTLSLLQEAGARVQGVEPSERQANAIRDALGIEVFNGLWEDAPIPPGSTDGIVWCHVLEHIRDPAAALDKARSTLTGEGRLFIEVPNIGAPSPTKRLGRWLAPEHVWYFTPRTLVALVERAGFRVERLEVTNAVRLVARPDPARATEPQAAEPHDLGVVALGVVRHELRYWPRVVVQKLRR